MYTFINFDYISLDSKSITCKSIYSFFSLIDFSSFQPTISYLTSLDKYAIICIFSLVIQCFWHAIIGVLIFYKTPNNSVTSSSWLVALDSYAFDVIAGAFILLHIGLVTWLYLVPFRERKNMLKEDAKYELLISNKKKGDNNMKGKRNSKTSSYSRIPMEGGQ